MTASLYILLKEEFSQNKTCHNFYNIRLKVKKIVYFVAVMKVN